MPFNAVTLAAFTGAAVKFVSGEKAQEFPMLSQQQQQIGVVAWVCLSFVVNAMTDMYWQHTNFTEDSYCRPIR